jgi:hypothetical protein
MQRVIVVGLGPIGASCARAIRAERGIKLTGLVDSDPKKVGVSLEDLGAGPGELDRAAGSEEEGQLRVVASLDACEGDTAVLCTASDFSALAPMIRTCIGRKMSVISTCEQMAWPWYRHAALAREIDAEAAAAGVAVLGTGVNPGFVMDALAVTLASMVRRVTSVRCVRRLDAGLRRGPLQRKVGATLSVETFSAMAGEGKLGHQGLPESVAMLAAGLGRSVEPGSVNETLEPVIADTARPSALGVIQPGQVAGVHHVATWTGDGLSVELDLTMAVGAADPVDKVKLEGPVSLMLKIPGAIPGDSATVAAVLNNIPHLPHVRPGLRSMIDMPPAGCHNRDFDGS